MILYVIRRFINYAILTVIATVLTYMLASSLLNPSSRYYGKNPRPSDDTVNRILSGLGVNPHVPLIERTWHWFTQIILHGSFGDTVSGTTVGHEIMVRSGVSLKLLIAGSLIGAFLGVAFGVWGAVKQYKGSDGVFAKDGKPLTLSITVPADTPTNAELDPTKQTALANAIDKQLYSYVRLVTIAPTPEIFGVAKDLVNYGARQFEYPDYTKVGFRK